MELLTEDAIVSKIIEIGDEQALGVEINAETQLFQWTDSLDAIGIGTALAEEFDVQISNDEIWELRNKRVPITVRDLAHFIQQKLS